MDVQELIWALGAFPRHTPVDNHPLGLQIGANVLEVGPPEAEAVLDAVVERYSRYFEIVDKAKKGR